ncbi:MAG: hypothetical protein IJN88_00150 [Clostridia bacterium]|nr:hypothetical protein [Clostridia bacterium]
MTHNIIGAVICALAGLLIAFGNYAFSRRVLEKSPDRLALATVGRQIIQVGYLIAVYLVGTRLTVNPFYLLVGAAAGMTVPMLFFTKKLVSFNESLAVKAKKREEDENG